ncbi:MAG: tRNA (adenosine(37)-N6)-dimethylallyltransferase MiaA [Anaerolineae bacterium]|nr:tRNA (adenosine(37)-N6)-dimethylallyltransferase MiaA [Anaerolineae bacterium]
MWRTRLTGKPLIVILGATAVGKTELALTIAETIHGEIVGADSRQIYTLMDIGTAKPTPEERARVPHHLIDLIQPDGDLSLANYQRLAYAAIDDIHTRGKVPLLVGGTGQYITAVIEGWSPPEVPPQPELRAELEAYAAAHGARALFDRLIALDPDAQAFIDPRNIRRVVRAIEVTQVTGQPFSAQRQKHPPPYQIQHYGLMLERERLYERADQRVDAMLAAGFLDEVHRLLAAGYDRTLPSMSGLGYRELAAHLLDGLPLAEAVTLTKNATHDFIRRQLTWFRGHDPGILWHNRDSVDIDALLHDVERRLQEI